jgi:long-chain fatty acid transport protein
MTKGCHSNTHPVATTCSRRALRRYGQTAVITVTTVAAALVMESGTATAQGFGLNEIGGCAIARGFAVTGAVCNDGSAIYWNPAATVRLPSKNTLHVGVSHIALVGGFRQDTTQVRYGSNIHPEIVPSLFYNRVINPAMAVGIGVYVPYGLTSQWHGDFPGRFSALKASLKTIYIQPNFSYAISPSWSIGGGPIFGTSRVELVQSADLSAQVATVQGGNPVTFGQLGISAGTEFARAQLKGSDNTFGFNLGIHGILAPGWTVGARYLSTLKFEYKDADATFRQIPTGLTLAAGNPIVPGGASTPLDAVVAGQFSGTGALVPQTASTEISHPWQAQVGIGYTGFPGTTLSFDVGRIGWSQFDVLPVTFNGAASGSNRVLIEDYEDIWVYRAGIEHTVRSSNALQGVTLRGGFSYAETPAPDVTVTPLLPDMARKNISFGVAVPVTTQLQLEASYLHVGTDGRRGRVNERASASQTATQLNTGAYDLKANVFSLALTAHF